MRAKDTDISIVSIIAVLHNLQRFSLDRAGSQFLLRCFLVIDNVLLERTSEETGLLVDDGEMRAKMVDLIILDIDPIDKDFSTAIVETLKQLHHRGLAAA